MGVGPTSAEICMCREEKVQQLASKALKRRALRHLVAAIQEYIQHKRRCRCASPRLYVPNLCMGVLQVMQAMRLSPGPCSSSQLLHRPLSRAEHHGCHRAEQLMICWLELPSHAS